MHFCIFCLANVAQLTTIYFYLGYFISSSCNRTGTFSKFKNCKQKFKNVKKKIRKTMENKLYDLKIQAWTRLRRLFLPIGNLH